MQRNKNISFRRQKSEHAVGVSSNLIPIQEKEDAIDKRDLVLNYPTLSFPRIKLIFFFLKKKFAR